MEVEVELCVVLSRLSLDADDTDDEREWISLEDEDFLTLLGLLDEDDDAAGAGEWEDGEAAASSNSSTREKGPVSLCNVDTAAGKKNIR